MKKISLSLSLLVLTACSSGSYPLKSNLDSDKINQFIKIGNVKLYSEQQLSQLRYKQIGLVEGESCQANPDLPPADEATARNLAREKVAAKGGNGFVPLNCVSTEFPGCFSHITCFGKAINVIKDDQ
ncbi:Rcs stress response system protein RcsF [Paraferrimonas sp. SM1919]|uniref:Rcs stress response system protein RcsF n=1 Tax=Paraferrimonas sp. SM1919 TaxID=2662263 RepID=UPI0013CFFB84|nr:Rcs stress response system protein RcsF [Paraferrimonas sp. SM1919]